ncbi:MAG: STAS domain-containing protein [Cyanobacteriota bacterium]|nr:STAS domain-containing protein [Cyanobacteriota bacterium]
MSPDAKVEVLQPQGILDGTKASEFRQEITNLVDKGAKIILIDCTDVTFMDSSGLGSFVLALKTVRAAGGKLALCSINDQLRMLFELTSMDRVFDIFANREDFDSNYAAQSS